MSSWELAWVVYQLEHGKQVEQCKEKFEYTMDGKIHHYTPDFIIDGIYYEIKNWHRPDTDSKIASFPKDKKLILVEGEKAIKQFLDYTVSKYGKEFWVTLYEDKNYHFTKNDKNKHVGFPDEIWEKRRDAILNSKVDLTAYGCLAQLEKETGLTRRQVCATIKRFGIIYSNGRK